MEAYEETLKNAAKGVGSVLILTLAITLAAKIADLYDFRILMGVLAGKLAFEPVFKLLGKIKALE